MVTRVRCVAVRGVSAAARDSTGDLVRADAAVADLAVRGRERVAPRPPARPLVPAHHRPRRLRATARRRRFGGLLARCPQRHARPRATRSHPAAAAGVAGLHTPYGRAAAAARSGDHRRLGRHCSTPPPRARRRSAALVTNAARDRIAELLGSGGGSAPAPPVVRRNLRSTSCSRPETEKVASRAVGSYPATSSTSSLRGRRPRRSISGLAMLSREANG